MSVLHLQRRLMEPNLTSNYMKRISLIIGGCILAWVLFSVFAIALQCGTTLPAHYRPGRCAGGALWYPVTTTNALTDAALAFSFFPIIMDLTMQKQTKIKVACLLGIRLVSVCLSRGCYFTLTTRQSLHCDHCSDSNSCTQSTSSGSVPSHGVSCDPAADCNEPLYLHRCYSRSSQLLLKPHSRSIWDRDSRQWLRAQQRDWQPVQIVVWVEEAAVKYRRHIKERQKRLCFTQTKSPAIDIWPERTTRRQLPPRFDWKAHFCQTRSKSRFARQAKWWLAGQHYSADHDVGSLSWFADRWWRGGGAINIYRRQWAEWDKWKELSSIEILYLQMYHIVCQTGLCMCVLSPMPTWPSYYNYISQSALSSLGSVEDCSYWSLGQTERDLTVRVWGYCNTSPSSCISAELNSSAALMNCLRRSAMRAKVLTELQGNIGAAAARPMLDPSYDV